MAEAGVADTDEDGDAQNDQSEHGRGSPETWNAAHTHGEFKRGISGVYIFIYWAHTRFLTCSEDREEVKPNKGDNGRRQSLTNGSQVDAAFDASRQVGKVQVVFVHHVFEHHVEEACGKQTTPSVRSEGCLT